MNPCPCCFGRHRIEQCPHEDAPASNAIIEVPSHNGIYQGSVPVRVLPQGVSGSKEFVPITWGNKAAAGHTAQSLIARNRRLAKRTRSCPLCGTSLAGRQIVYCSESCKNRAWLEKCKLNGLAKQRREHASLRRMASQDRGAHYNRRKQFCKHGHPFDEANTLVDRAGKRKCRACMKARER